MPVTLVVVACKVPADTVPEICAFAAVILVAAKVPADTVVPTILVALTEAELTLVVAKIVPVVTPVAKLNVPPVIVAATSVPAETVVPAKFTAVMFVALTAPVVKDVLIRPVPETSRVAVGAEVAIPMLPELAMMKFGVVKLFTWNLCELAL